MPLSNWAAQAFQKTVTNVFYSRGVSSRRRRTRRPAQQTSLESLEPRQMLSVNPASSGSTASSANDNSNIAAFVSQNTIGILSVPSAPTSVVAVSGNTSLAVTWTAPANTGGSNITDYLVKYSSNGGSTWTNFVHPVSTVPSLTVTGLTNGTAYVIKVIARNAIGISLPSANSAPVTPALLAMSMVTVGNVGNAADANTGSLYGAVSYSYQIGAYDVTGSQYTAFLNAVGSTDIYALYNASMGSDTDVAQISQSGSSGSYTYAVLNRTGNRPVTYVNWWDGARFSNWMSNGQPSGAQNSTTTENGAYNLNGATSGNPVAKNATNPNTGLAPTYGIPLENEWYKAAYYSPNYGGTGVGGYYAYATQSNSVPGTTIGSGANQANYNSAIGTATDVGSFSGSGSFYGTFDQSGNVYQWNDLDGTAGSSRRLRGGFWGNGSYHVSSSHRSFNGDPSIEDIGFGFRLASPVTVPSAPTSVVAVSGNAQLAVTWAAPASTGGSNITEYLVKYSSNNGVAGSWTRFFPSPVVPITATSCTVTGLTNGTAFVIKVIARNTVGISLPSTNFFPATPAATVPGTPTSVVATSGNAGLAVTWTAPANTGGAAITDYLVKYSSNNGVAGSWTRYKPSSPITATSCTVTGLTNGTRYVIKVIARNAVGISPPSANSAPVPVFTNVHLNPTSQTVNYSASQAQLSYGDEWSFEMPSRDVWNNQIFNFTGPSTATSGTDRLVVILTIPQGPVVAGFSTTPTGTYSFQFTNSTTSAVYTINFTVTS